MSTQTSFVARQYKLREWDAQIQECKNRASDMTVVKWCQEHDITPANYYCRQSEVRKALLQSLDSKEMESSTGVLPFVEISGKVAAVSDPAVNSAIPSASLRYRDICIDLYNSANADLVRSLIEAISHAE